MQKKPQTHTKPQKHSGHWTKLSKKVHMHAVLQHFQALSPHQTTTMQM